jgi:hypothetical protein
MPSHFPKAKRTFLSQTPSVLAIPFLRSKTSKKSSEVNTKPKSIEKTKEKQKQNLKKQKKNEHEPGQPQYHEQTKVPNSRKGSR